MKLRLTITAMLVAAMLAVAMPATAQGNRTYQVTITNLTRGQAISPPIVVSHHRDVELWRAGTPASAELAALAEDADASGLLSLLGASAGVHDVAMAAAPLPPGGSVVLEIDAPFPFVRVSALGMLVTTNDAFFGLQGVELPPRRQEGIHDAVAYDAGSEANNEDCAFIPGPPCGNEGVRATDGAEGVVHVHAGVHGIADLVPAMHDWRNPVVRVVIQANR
jgi:hypothetical protein